jgi:hypothetical protein
MKTLSLKTLVTTISKPEGNHVTKKPLRRDDEEVFLLFIVGPAQQLTLLTGRGRKLKSFQT